MGVFSLVLHTHLPYVRRNGVWPSGEEFFHQAALESYLPLLGVLESLADDGFTDALTLGLSPMIAHQMEDAHMLRELSWFLGLYELRTLRQTTNYEGVFRDEFRDLAAHYARFARAQSDRLDGLTGGGIATEFDALARRGTIEIIGGPATHPYLPLVREPALAAAQVELGAAEYARLFERRPEGMWLPECAYEPDAGIEGLLERSGVGHIVIDGPTMLRSAGPGSTFAPRRIRDSAVVACARNLDVTYRVWSPTGGYPTGKWYRDFFHYDIEGGFKNWRVTSIRKPVAEKRPYEPARAQAAARKDAEDFAALIARTLAEHESQTGREGHVVAAYDTELFGHWWYEGPIFLEHLFRTLRDTPGVRALSLRGALACLPAPERVDLVGGSWGFRKDDRSWVAPETDDMWQALGEVEADTIRYLEKFRDAGPGRRAAVAQLAREAMLMQSSDWPFMVLRGRNPAYARERFFGHRARWNEMVELLRSRIPDDLIARKANDVYEIDNILPALTPESI
ncbi:MAG TPA: 1,4-alpha-glucan branching protein domain-containing protein [Actinomycetota bacterium]|nr:1,4-alpha-glucan branching protein domain-containing protein [Actinomycetota bacterium]